MNYHARFHAPRLPAATSLPAREWITPPDLDPVVGGGAAGLVTRRGFRPVIGARVALVERDAPWW